MNISKKVKYRKDDPEQLALGTRIMVEAYKSSKRTKHRIDAVKKATKKLTSRERAELPDDGSIDQHLRKLINYVQANKCPTDEKYGYQIVIKNAYMEITNNQISINDEFDKSEVDETVSVNALSPQDDVASQCDENPVDNTDDQDPVEQINKEMIYIMSKFGTLLINNNEEIDNIITASKTPSTAEEALKIRYEITSNEAKAIIRVKHKFIADLYRKEAEKWESLF